MTRLRWWTTVSIGMAVAVFAAIKFAALWLPLVARWLDVGGALSPVDVVVALSGDDERRPFVAAALVNAGLAKRVIVVENEPSPDVMDRLLPKSHVIATRIIQSRGLQPNQIVLLPGESTSTADEVDRLKQYLVDHPEQRACVVTNAYHTRRTRWTLHNRLPDQYPRVSVVSAPNPEFDCDNWWHTPTALEAVLSEYVKLGWYFLCYGQGVLAVCVGVVSCLMAPWCWGKVTARWCCI